MKQIRRLADAVGEFSISQHKIAIGSVDLTQIANRRGVGSPARRRLDEGEGRRIRQKGLQPATFDRFDVGLGPDLETLSHAASL